MTLQQLRYIIQIVQSGSISMAAQKLYITQPSLSKSVSDLEKEMGITIFNRNNRGVYLSDDGARFLAYARQIVDQADLLERRYKSGPPIRRVFAVSSQHYAFAVDAFAAFVQAYQDDQYEFALRESRTYDIIEDVRTQRSELGILYLSKFNRDVLRRIFQNAELDFVPLFKARPHVFLSRNHPLARRKTITLRDLRPFPRLSYEQGLDQLFHFKEELHSTEEAGQNIIVSDKSTMFQLMTEVQGYNIASGALNADPDSEEIVSVPLKSAEVMDIGYVHPSDHPLSALSDEFLGHLHECIEKFIQSESRS